MEMKQLLTILAAAISLTACTGNSLRSCSTDISTIDSTLQTNVDSLLENKLIELNAFTGTAIVMEVHSGHIKAIAGLEKDSTGYWPCDNYIRNQESALVQPACMLAAMEEGDVRMSEPVDVGNGVCLVRGKELKDHNWHKGGYGMISVMQGMACSSNIAVYKTMDKVFGKRKEAFFDVLAKTGYGKPDSIDGLPGLEPAFFIRNEAVDWQNSLAWISIGYDQYIASVQVLAFYNGIANGGRMVQPGLYKDAEAVIFPQMAKQAHIDNLKQVLEYTVTDGLRKPVRSGLVRIAGKPGTVQLDNGDYLVEFCGYFPAENPAYSVIVSIRKKDLPASGGGMAGDLFCQIAEYLTGTPGTQDTQFYDCHQDCRYTQVANVEGEGVSLSTKAGVGYAPSSSLSYIQKRDSVNITKLAS